MVIEKIDASNNCDIDDVGISGLDLLKLDAYNNVGLMA